MFVAYMRKTQAPISRGFLGDFTIHRTGYADRSVELVESMSRAYRFTDLADVYIALGVALEDCLAHWRVVPILVHPIPSQTSTEGDDHGKFAG